MSEAKWCDIGGHAYSANDLGGTTVTVTQRVGNQWGGQQPASVVQDICGDCIKEHGLFRTSTKTLTAEPDGSFKVEDDPQ